MPGRMHYENQHLINMERLYAVEVRNVARTHYKHYFAAEILERELNLASINLRIG